MTTPDRHAYDAGYFAARERSPTLALELYAIRRVLTQFGALPGRVLELGAGSGALARACGYEATLWVAADRDLRFFDRNLVDDGSAQLLACDARCPPIAARSCDAVVAQHLIEHFREPDLVLKGWAALLKKGGVCVLATPNRLFPRLSWFDDPTHQVLFSADELSALMKGAGFRRVRVRRLVPWLGSERTVYLAARLQRKIPGALNIGWDPSLNLLAVGSL